MKVSVFGVALAGFRLAFDARLVPAGGAPTVVGGAALATLGIKTLIEWRTIAADAAASGPTQENRK